jgi:hypothetical protein
MRGRVIASLASLCLSGAAFAADAKFNYPLDEAPLKKHAKEATELDELRTAGFEKPATEQSLRRQLEILEEVSKAEPNWIDGYWMIGEAAFQLGNSLSNPKDIKGTRAIFVKGQEATEKCLKIDSKNVLCKMFLGASLGKIASIDGIFSSLRRASAVEALWLDITKSGIDHRLSPNSTLQGSARYALGLYNRLVPDSFILKMMFGARGDIQKSISFHKESVEADGGNTCNLMMLGVAQICSVKGDVKDKVGIEGLKNLADAKTKPITNAMGNACARDIPKIEKDPSLACGYETTRQQEETSDEDIKKLKN